MKALYLAVLFALAALAWSCGSNDDPVVNPPQYRISWIGSDDAYQLFDYDADGRIAKWNYNVTDGIVIASTFDYQTDGKSIKIKSEEKLTESDVWTFDETLHLNPDGTASRAEGTAILNTDGSRITKNYTADFQYNSSHQLIKINTSEAVVDDYGQEGKPLEWAVELTWTGNNLVQYTEYSNPDYPMSVRKYEYFGGETADYIPVVQGCIFRRFYLPLQYQDVLGANSAGLVKRMTASTYGTDIVTEFSYKIAASVYSSAVEEYTETRNGRESVYTMAWEPMPKK